MTILSLDLSTKSSGWAIFRDTMLIDSGCITSSSLDLLKRINVMIEGFNDILVKHSDITKVIAEEVRPENGLQNIKTHRALMWLQGGIALALYAFNKKLELDLIYPSSWRAAIGIKTGRGVRRSSLKEKDIQFVKENYNLDVNDDIADAICIGYANSHDVETEINWE